jgi:hypothetical protein
MKADPGLPVRVHHRQVSHCGGASSGGLAHGSVGGLSGWRLRTKSL